MTIYDTREGVRLLMNHERRGNWNLWGPFLAERAWGTVREDYSASGDAWSYFPHDHARSRTYRWNEDGLLGFCDRHQHLCFALAVWNGRDPILKERAFGLGGPEGNHGEDVKEYYFYLDGTPSHSYMKAVYKYPQGEFPYADLIAENRRRTRDEAEYELIDTGAFADNRYFDVEVEYAKADAEDILVRITVSNRGPDTAAITVLPTLWFRNTWSWGRHAPRPRLEQGDDFHEEGRLVRVVHAHQTELGHYVFYSRDADELVFTENETNAERVFGSPSASPYVKDAFHEFVVNGRRDAVNPDHAGSKAAVVCARTVPAGASVTLQFRLAAAQGDHVLEEPFADFDAHFAERIAEADEFYGVVLPGDLGPDAKLVARQAFAGMLWTKQFYHYGIDNWLEGDPHAPPPPAQRLHGRNSEWQHLYNRDVISMPDKWEFPWYASWDLGFHCTAFAHIDPQYAKDQIILMLREWYMHPNGQIPAYEWNFDDVNPPLLPLAAISVFNLERIHTGHADYDFLERVFQKFLLNFTWWVNRKDALGNDIFQGGFLGMDNIGAFDRDNMPEGYLLGQADGTSWMAAFAKSMLAIALTLAQRNPVYEDLASKFWEHFVYIANAMNGRPGSAQSLWDEADGFFYDTLIAPDGERMPIRTRSMVGLTPLFGAYAVPADAIDKFPSFKARRNWFIEHRDELMHGIGPLAVPNENKLLLNFVRPDQLRSLLRYMLDENEFLSPCGVRSVSRFHAEQPFVIHIAGREYRLDYEPGESNTDLFGGNSNWRGPIWMPMNFLLLLSLEHYHLYLGDDFKVEHPTGSGQMKTLHEVRVDLGRRLGSIFLRGADGKRRVFGDNDYFNTDPHWRDMIPFHEYFHGDTGRGCGASHQTGWTGLIAEVIVRFHEEFSGDRSAH